MDILATLSKACKHGSVPIIKYWGILCDECYRVYGRLTRRHSLQHSDIFITDKITAAFSDMDYIYCCTENEIYALDRASYADSGDIFDAEAFANEFFRDDCVNSSLDKLAAVFQRYCPRLKKGTI